MVVVVGAKVVVVAAKVVVVVVDEVLLVTATSPKSTGTSSESRHSPSLQTCKSPSMVLYKPSSSHDPPAVAL